MCNPRRVHITATRALTEAWQHLVTRAARDRRLVSGEARVRQSMVGTLGGPALAALESAFANAPEWTETDQGYRCEVEGGYALYDLDQQTLEIVATLEDVVEVEERVQQVLTGEINETVSAEANADYYDDGYGGRTERWAQEQANQTAARRLDELRTHHLSAAARSAEAAAAADIEARAQAAARHRAETEADARRQDLNHQAAARLDTVGLRCRRAFNTVLARAYRDALLAYARRAGAHDISCQDGDDGLHIEFRVTR